MTRDEIVTAIQGLGYASDILTVQQGLVQRHYDRLFGLRRWKWREAVDTSLSTVANTATVSLTGIADLPKGYEPDAVRISLSGVDYPLDWLEPEELRARWKGNTVPSTPLYWTYYAGQLQFYPVPDKVYAITVEYLKQSPTLAGTTEPLFDKAHHSVLVYLPAADLAARQRDWDARREFQAAAAEDLRALFNADGSAQRQTGLRVKASGFFDNPADYGLLDC